MRAQCFTLRPTCTKSDGTFQRLGSPVRSCFSGFSLFGKEGGSLLKQLYALPEVGDIPTLVYTVFSLLSRICP